MTGSGWNKMMAVTAVAGALLTAGCGQATTPGAARPAGKAITAPLPGATFTGKVLAARRKYSTTSAARALAACKADLYRNQADAIAVADRPYSFYPAACAGVPAWRVVTLAMDALTRS